MKNSKFILALVVSSAFVPMVRAQTDPASTNANSTNVTYAIISRDANSRQWAKIISATNAAGQVTTTTNRAYTELATGICYQQNGSGPWLDAVEQIDITADGAQATQGRHTVHWMGNVNTAGGSVHLVSPDGKDFLSMVYGLAYWDTATGSNVLIASLQDSHGQRVGSNRVVYSNAFQNLNADIEYVYNKSGLEQNIILLAQPPSPATLGLNPETSRMQVLTEFYSPPVPQIMTDTSGGVSEDTLLDFGEMKIGIGNALFFQGEGEPVPINEERVAKHWTNLEGRDFLIEEIPWSAISNAVQELPPQASTTNSQPTAVEHMASLLPLSPPKAAGAREPKPLRVAHTMPRKPGVVIDYSQMSTSATNYVFQANVTYYVSGNVNLYGASAFEGGTVIKYTNTASATLDQLDPNGSFIFESCAYRPAVFTSANDNSLADAIKGSTGSPAQGKGIYLQWTAGGNDTTPEITDARFSYAGIAYQANTTNFHVFQNCQFLNCGTNVSLSHDTNVCFYNVLAANCGAVVVGTPVIDAENITVDSCTKFDASSSTNGGITNSIFTAVAGGTNFTFTNCFMSNSGALLYLRVGAGNYYLATNASTESNGTININPALLQDLQGLTTHPPSVYSNATISVASTLGIQANREAETPGPDLGYHYAPLDYVFGGTKVNQNLTFSPGVAVGYFNASSSGYGISMANSMSATFQGSEEAPLWWVRANTVQEGRSDTNWPGINIVGGLVGLGDSQSGGNIALSPEMNLLFTHCSVLANGDEACGQHFRDDSAYLIVNATNCEFHGGQLGYGYVISCYFTNCLMDRTAACQEQGFPGNQYVVQNCTFHGGDLFMVPYSTPIQITVRDSTFDGTDILDYGYGTNTATVSYDYNAFTNSSGKFAIGGAHDQIVTNGFNWQTSWLGTFYLPSNSPLILSGDASATNYGLYHFTTQTNQAPEGDAIVDIGYHYVATDNYGNPLSTYIPGIPDYVLDANGTGVYSSGDLLDWMNPFAIYDQGVNYGGYYPQHVRLGYWKFDTAALTNQAGKAPFCSSSMIALPSWASNAVSMTTTNSAADLEYYLVQDGNWTNFDYRNGTIRFWYQPTWPSTFLEETNANYGTFFQVGGGTNGDWAVFASTSAGSRVIQFQSWSNGYMLFPICEPLYLQPNLWYQIALTFSPTNIALYTNGVLVTTGYSVPSDPNGNPVWTVGNGLTIYPSADFLATNNSSHPPTFSFGNNGCPAQGTLDELETFNYPLTPQAIAAGFPTFAGNPTNIVDSAYVGRSDMMQNYVDGVSPPGSSPVVPCRLGYWRFDTPDLFAEQGQIPKSQSGVTLSNSWSGTAANIGSSTNSQLTYWDVFTNGWANINCQSGSVRFWFKPNWSSVWGPGHAAPFIYLGDNSATPTNKWSLEVNAAGNTINFINQANGYSNAVLSGPCNFTPSNWCQIVLNYGPAGSALYINGVLVTNGAAVSEWPSTNNRALGMVIGNNTAHSESINGAFDELETFNFQLSSNEIATNFQTVLAVDSNLDGVPDVLEDIVLTNGSRPYLGQPVVITGSVKAEQFDMGGPNIAYFAARQYPANVYRATGMFITNCDDLGLGSCLAMGSSDWANYTINILAAGTYTVEARVDGIGTGGVFQFGITNLQGLGVLSTKLTNTTTGWTNLSSQMTLTNVGTNILTLCGLTGGTQAPYVGRFNYISIYPYCPVPTIGPGWTNVSGLTNNLTNYVTASNNAYQIQSAINSLYSGGGGTVFITNGVYYVAQLTPNENTWACYNAAVSVISNNIQICGAGATNITNTTLVAFDRVTAVFSVGADQFTNLAPVTNFTLCNLTIEGQPHNVSYPNTNGLGYTNLYELGEFNPPLIDRAPSDAGSLTVFYEYNTNVLANNILITNCEFLHTYWAVKLNGVSNCAIQGCAFIQWDSNCTFTGAVNNSPTNTANTDGITDNNVSIFGGGDNIVLLDNIYNGNAMFTGNTFVNTNTSNTVAPNGWLWLQGGGNVLVARNAISNNQIEAIQLNAGPNSVVQNTFSTLVNCTGGECALNFAGGGPPDSVGIAGYGPPSYSTTFINNWIYGESTGALTIGAGVEPYASSINVSGNYFNDPFIPFNEIYGGYGAMVGIEMCQTANICGNTMVAGGYGVAFTYDCTNALILNNDFSGASYLGIGYQWGSSSLPNACVFGNKIGKGLTFHARMDYTESFGWFFKQNQYLNGTNIVPPFFDPAASEAHVSN